MDSTTDNSFRTLWGFMKTAGIPDYVRSGALVDAGDAPGLSSSAFADPAGRHFPITDKANTWASAGYFAKTASDYGYTPAQREAVELGIRRAAEIYGIADDVDGLMKKVAGAAEPQVKQASAEDYCDPEHQGYPVFDKEGAEMANDFFSRNAYKYGHERRMAIARNIMKKCAQYGVKAAEQVRCSAGEGFPSREVMAEHLLFRADELLRRGINKMASELCKFANEICIASDEDIDRNREGLFDAIGAIDETTGLDELYGKRFLPPEEMIFDIPFDEMKGVVDDSVPLGRDHFSASALAGLPRKLFEMVLPKESVDGMMEDGKISPKKLKVTIISLKSPESSHLLQTIKDFTDGVIDVDDEPEGAEIGGEMDDGDKVEISNDSGKIEVETEKGDADPEKSEGKDENKKED